MYATIDGGQAVCPFSIIIMEVVRLLEYPL